MNFSLEFLKFFLAFCKNQLLHSRLIPLLHVPTDSVHLPGFDMGDFHSDKNMILQKLVQRINEFPHKNWGMEQAKENRENFRDDTTQETSSKRADSCLILRPWGMSMISDVFQHTWIVLWNFGLLRKPTRLRNHKRPVGGELRKADVIARRSIWNTLEVILILKYLQN